MFTTISLSLPLVLTSFVVMFFGGLGWSLAAWIVGRVLR